MNKNYFKLFSYNIPVYGKEKSAIYNLQDNQLYSIPSQYFSCINTTDDQVLDNTSNHPILRELEIKGLGFFTDSPKNFPKIDLEFTTNSMVETAVLSYSEQYNVTETLAQLETLRCKHIEIRFENCHKISISNLSFLEFTSKSSLRSINLIFDYQAAYDEKFCTDCFLLYPKVRNIIFLGAPLVSNAHRAEHEKVFYIDKSFQQINASELLPIQPQTMINKDFFIRSQHVNAYYYGKICISKTGKIKNNLQHTPDFGQIQNISLQQVLQEGGIKEMWNIGPDRIDGLKDSHLRYGKIITGRLLKKSDNLYKFI